MVDPALAVEVKKIEGIEEKPLRSPPDGRLQRIEIRGTALVLHDYLTVEDSGTTVELGSSIHDG